MQLEPIISGTWFLISYIRVNIIPLLLAAIGTLLLREYVSWKVNLRNERIQKFEKLIEEIYGPLNSMMTYFIEEYSISMNQIGIYEFQLEKIREISIKYPHEIHRDVLSKLNLLVWEKKPLRAETREVGKVLYFDRWICENLDENVQIEYFSDLLELKRYRKMREGFWRNLWFYINPLIFRETKKKE